MFPRPECNCSPTKVHYWVCINTYKWECKFCHTVAVFPPSIDKAISLNLDISKYGLDVGYNKWLKDNDLIQEMIRPCKKKLKLRKKQKSSKD